MSVAWGVAMVFGLIVGAVAFTMTIINLRLYREKVPGGGSGGSEESASEVSGTSTPLLCVCVPARNEEANIEACVRSLLEGGVGRVQVLVYDDQSTDGTPAILTRLIGEDARVVRVPTVPLPSGWNGKQHACWRMARAALDHRPADRARWLLFTDADVRFSPGALREAVEIAECRGVGLLSTFPRQITGSWAERAVVPMIFFILFSYLPMPRMRRTLDPASSAGCGQFLLVRADAYEASGGHEGFKDSMHDGIRLPRAIRRAGFKTDLYDGTQACSVRMYRGLAQTWRGFAKNAYEGLGSVGLLVFITVAHLCGHVLPWVYLVGAWGLAAWPTTWAGPALACIVLGLWQRMMLARAFGHGWASVAMHPLGVLMMTAIQWHSLVLAKTGRRAWRGRVQGAATA